MLLFLFFFFQAEDGIRDRNVTGVQTCALPILGPACSTCRRSSTRSRRCATARRTSRTSTGSTTPSSTSAKRSSRTSGPTRRSEERRVGKECRYRRSADEEKKKEKQANSGRSLR